MKSKIFVSLCIGLLIAVSNSNVFAQEQSYTKQTWTKEDSSAFNALVLYPDTIRLDIFEACIYPAAVVNIASIQKNSSNDFANAISSYSKDDQEDFWNLGRYPDLVSKLAQGGKKSEAEINSITAGYPDDIRKSALKHGRSDYDVIKNIDNIYRQSNSQFEQTIADYPAVTQDAFRELLGYPEIMTLLNEHLNLAVRIGDRYKRDPQRVIHRTDSMNLVIVRQNAEDVQAWKDSVQNNPDEANDLKGAANDYAQENGYTSNEINEAPNPEYVNNYVCSPYSYWFGYPTWYPYHYWYPYPYWFDCGFYHDAYGHIVIIGMPSYYFTNWYFYYPEHWHHYPHLANGYISHYYGPRQRVSANALVVRGWVNDNSRYLPHDFIAANPRTRVETIRQVAQLNVDAGRMKGGGKVTPAVRDQYFQQNVTKYPALNPAFSPRMQPETKPVNMPDVREQPTKLPPVRIPPKVEQQQPQPPVRITPPRTEPQQPQSTPRPVETPSLKAEPRNYNFENINKAQEYHRNTWEQSQPQPRQQAQPAPRQQQPAVRPPQASPPRQAPAPQQSNPGRKK